MWRIATDLRTLLVGLTTTLALGMYGPVSASGVPPCILRVQEHGDSGPVVNTLFIYAQLATSACAVEFGLGGTHTIVELRPSSGFVNEGSATSPRIVPIQGGIDVGTIIAEVEVANDVSQGDVCFRESDITGRLCYLDCGTGTWHHTYHDGYAEHLCAGQPDSEGCSFVVSIDRMSWGRILSVYR